jgi:hypothetical protein
VSKNKWNVGDINEGYVEVSSEKLLEVLLEFLLEVIFVSN